MIDSVEFSHGVRLDWACTMVNVYQAAFGDALDGDPTCVDAIADRLRRFLPRPISTLESVYAAHLLVTVIERAGEALHERFHSRFAPGACESGPVALFAQLTPGPALTFGHVIDRWHREYSAWFDAHHTLPPALRAKRVLLDRFSEPWTTLTLAEAVGASRTTLIAHFMAAFGMPPAEYLARVRLRAGLRRLRTGERATNAADAVGHRSAQKFNVRLRRYMELTATRIRRLTDSEFDELLEQRLSLRGAPTRDGNPSNQ